MVIPLIFPIIFPTVPQSSLGILRVPQLPPPLGHPPVKNPVKMVRRWSCVFFQLRILLPFSMLVAGPSAKMGAIYWKADVEIVEFRNLKSKRQGESYKSFTTTSSSRWWFQIFFIFTPKIGEMIQFDEHIFQMG